MSSWPGTICLSLAKQRDQDSLIWKLFTLGVTTHDVRCTRALDILDTRLLDSVGICCFQRFFKFLLLSDHGTLISG